MTRKEFLTELGNNLKTIPAEESSEVIRYYEEIFDGAEENGEDVHKLTEKLGSPFGIATQIKNEGGFTAPNQNFAGYANANYTANTNIPPVKTGKKVSTAGIIWGILASPIWIALFCSAWAVVISAIATIFSVGVSVGAVSLMFFVYGFANLFTTFATGVVVLGCALVSAGIFFMILKPFLIAIKYCAVYPAKATAYLFNKSFFKEVPVGGAV
jgi:uncharacterized membrane protein